VVSIVYRVLLTGLIENSVLQKLNVSSVRATYFFVFFSNSLDLQVGEIKTKQKKKKNNINDNNSTQNLNRFKIGKWKFNFLFFFFSLGLVISFNQVVKTDFWENIFCDFSTFSFLIFLTTICERIYS
jgi:hypothetical protein